MTYGTGTGTDGASSSVRSVDSVQSEQESRPRPTESPLCTGPRAPPRCVPARGLRPAVYRPAGSDPLCTGPRAPSSGECGARKRSEAAGEAD